MDDEINSIYMNKTWDLVQLPENKKAIGCKWVYKLKFDDQGNVSRYKARLVAQGFSQKYGEDYDEVFAPVARATTFQVLLSIAGINNYHVKHFDIKTAFLYGEIEEEIYMKQPPGYAKNNMVCKLNKSLYGLKQAARAWNKVLHEALLEFGFEQNNIDKCLYIYMSDDRKVLYTNCYLIVHVDDILLVSSTSDLIDKLYNHLSSKFELKDLGNVRHFLGIDISKDSNGNYVISQSQYIDKIITEAGLADGKVSKYHLMTGYFRHKYDEMLKSNNMYRKLIGMLLYVSNNTRPDISASVAILSKKVSAPTKTDLNEVRRTVRYLNGTKFLKLKLSDETKSPDLHIYSDASWAEDPSDRKSNSGYCCLLNGGTVSWCSRKQDIVALSSTESEFIALTESCKELKWIRMMVKSLKEVTVPEKITVLTDSQSSMKLITNQKFSNRSKHIDTRFYYVKQLVEEGQIELKYCQTDLNIADMFTKPLGSLKIQQLRRMAGLDEYKATNYS
jgi:ribonuclease HI